MFLNSLNLQNFRSYRQKSFEFKNQTTLIVGPNASGKTNLLEAICLLARGKSFRAQLEKEMIGYGEELARVAGKITEGARDHFSKSLLRNSKASHDAFFVGSLRDTEQRGNHIVRGPNTHTTKNDHFASLRLEVILTTGQVQKKKTAGKIFKVNAVNRRWRDFVGSLKVVLFRPEDIEIVLGSPAIRRDYLDSVLEQVDLLYRQCQLVYQKGLRQRNKLLDRIREGQANRSQLEYWNRLLIKNGEIISRKREEMIDFFNFSAKGGSTPDWQPSIFNKNLTIEYDKSAISPARLAKYAEAEVALGMTLVGPQRDNIKFKVQKGEFLRNARFKVQQDLALFGSRGEQRIAILALKMAELAFMEQKSEEKPVLLLDDIFSELDEEHRSEVLSLLDKQQTIITATETDLVQREFLDKIEVIEL